MRGAMAVMLFSGLAFASAASAQDQPVSRTGGASGEGQHEQPGSGHDAFVRDAQQREDVVSGTVVSNRRGEMVVRIDDHHHLIPFQLSPKAASEDVRPGSQVEVRYHPTGATGQEADDVQVRQGPRTASRGRSEGNR